MSKKHDTITRHDEVEELIGSPPSWLVRRGITVIFIVIITLLTGAYFFRYPEIISSSVVITAEHPAIWLVSQTNGRIDSVYVKDQSKIDKDQIVATIENTASMDDVLFLKRKLESITEGIKNKGADSLLILPRDLNVGELNDCYIQLIKSMDDYTLFRKERYHELKVEALEIQKKMKLRHLNDMESQNKSHTEYAAIIKKQYTRDSVLYIKGVNSNLELETTQKEKISSDIQLHQSQSNISLVRLEIHQIEQGVAEINLDFKDKEKNYYNNLVASYELLHNRILEWEKRYILKSPSAGQISFLKFWSKNQYVNSNERIFTVIPEDYGTILGKCYVKTSGIGKIKERQTVMIKLDEFPYMEFGMIEGHVSNISLIGIEENRQDQQNRYAVVEIRFNKKNLTSTYHKTIDFKGELTGTAEIATKEISLLEHLINPLKYLWSNVR